MSSLPRVRPGLLRHVLDKQVMVYDPSENSIHLLDLTTACVLELLEQGGWDSGRMAGEVSSRTSMAVGEDLIALSLDELRKANLLDGSAALPNPMTEVSRRDVMKKAAAIGISAFLVPAIVTLVPSPLYALSCSSVNNRDVGCACSFYTQCQSFDCSGGVCVVASCTSTINRPISCACQGDQQCQSFACYLGFCAF